MDGFHASVFRDHSEKLSPGAAKRSDNGRISLPIFLALVRMADILLLLGAWVVTSAITDKGLRGGDLLAIVPALFVASWALNGKGIYRLPRLRLWSAQIAGIGLPLLGAAIVYAAGLALQSGAPLDPLRAPICWMLLAGASLALTRFVLARVIAAPTISRRLSRSIAVVGANATSQRFIERIQADRQATDHVVGVFDDRRSRVSDMHAGVPVMGRIEDLLAKGRRQPIDAIVVALPLSAAARIGDLCERLKSTVSDVYLTADVAGDRFDAARFGNIGVNPVIEVARQPLGATAAAQKRLFDLVVGTLMLLLVGPVMLLAALAIRVESPGPILFRQMRRGFNNNDFTVLKFRTMHHHLGDPAGRCQTMRDDPRVTAVGRILRRLSFDELPQLLNVLRGDMSLVGPRPHALNTRAGELLLEEAAADYALRHRVKPGITGWAQVNGSRGAILTEAHLRCRVDHDLYYIDNWSLWLDVKILVRTLSLDTHRGNV